MKHHPEQKENEIYMGNVRMTDESYPFYENKTSWKSNRYGNTAYTHFGEPLNLPNYRPWFITIEEVQSAINRLKWEIENIPCSWNKNKEETIKLYQKMIDNRSVWDN